MATLTSLNNRSGCMRRRHVRRLLLLLTTCFIHEAYFGPENWASWIRGDSLRLSTAPSRVKPVAAAAVSNRWMRSQPLTELPLQWDGAASISVTCTNTHTPLGFFFSFFSICTQGRGGGKVEETEEEEDKDDMVWWVLLYLYLERRQKSGGRWELTSILGVTCVCQGERQGGGDKGGVEGLTEASLHVGRGSTPCCLKSQSLDTFSCYIFGFFLFC